MALADIIWLGDALVAVAWVLGSVLYLAERFAIARASAR